MKKILKSIGIVAIAIGTLSMPFACDVEEDCSMNARAMMQCNLFQIDEETNEKNSIALTTLTVTAFGYLNCRNSHHDESAYRLYL